MDHLTAIGLYMRNGGTVCPFDDTKIIRREVNSVLTNAYQQAAQRGDVHVKETECEKEHLLMEFYDGDEMTSAMGDLLKRIKK